MILLLGDATGHGIGPALSVTQVRAMLRVAVRLGAGIDAAYTQINAQLTDDLSDNRFVTVFLGELDASSHRLHYHSGGQGPLLHFHAASGECEWLTATTFAMGMIAGIPLKAPKVFELAPGDIVGLITDGIFEYADRSSELFGEERTAAVVREHCREPMAALRERLVRAVAEFADGAPQGDDMTIVLVRRLPS